MHDGVIAVGGGSGMDGGKAIALTANNCIDLWAFEYESPPPDVSGQTPFPPLITIPTTAGTGAETEGTAMITETGRMLKLCIWHPQFRPRAALLDPALCTGLPKHLTAWTGLDALIHALEAYCVPGFHPMCDGIALQGLQLISAWLIPATQRPDHLEARGGMLAGSCLAGVAFLKGLGLVHAISHMVGAEYDTHHGLTNAIVLPAVLRFNRDTIVGKVPAINRAMGIQGDSFEDLYQFVCGLLDRLQIPRSLAEIGVATESAGQIATKAALDSAAATNPRQASPEELHTLVLDAIIQGR